MKLNSHRGPLRTSILLLTTEEDRHKGIPEEQHVCVLCDLGVVEDDSNIVSRDLRNHQLKNLICFGCLKVKY